jgi:hypothetical protein
MATEHFRLKFPTTYFSASGDGIKVLKGGDSDHSADPDIEPEKHEALVWAVQTYPDHNQRVTFEEPTPEGESEEVVDDGTIPINQPRPKRRGLTG